MSIWSVCEVSELTSCLLSTADLNRGLAWPSNVARRASAVTVPCGTGAQSGSGPVGPTRQSNGSRSDSFALEDDEDIHAKHNICIILELGGRKGVKGTMPCRKRGKHAQRSCQDARPHAATPQGQKQYPAAGGRQRSYQPRENSPIKEPARHLRSDTSAKASRDVQSGQQRSDRAPKPLTTSKAANKSIRHNADARGQNQRTACHLHNPMGFKKA